MYVAHLSSQLQFPLPFSPPRDQRRWTQFVELSLVDKPHVNQTRGQLIHCPYYRPFSSLDQGAPSPPFLNTADHHFEWHSIHTNLSLAIIIFVVHPAFHYKLPQVTINRHPIYHCESCIITWWNIPTALPGHIIAWISKVAELHDQPESFGLFSHTIGDFIDRFWKPIFPYVRATLRQDLL